MHSLPQIEAIRAAEIKRIIPFLDPSVRILEIGAGTGAQARELSRRGFDVTAIDLPSSNYAADRVYPVLNYDGRTIPLPDRSVDIVFSSNVLEHVPDLTRLHAEIRRVLRPDGYCIHVLPTHGWRFWTLLTAVPDSFRYLLAALSPRPADAGVRSRRSALHRAAGRILQRRHGERGNVISELWLFHPEWWRRNFRDNGFIVLHDQPIGLFYTGNMFLGLGLGPARRERLATVLGSACHLFKLGIPNKTG